MTEDDPMEGGGMGGTSALSILIIVDGDWLDAGGGEQGGDIVCDAAGDGVWGSEGERDCGRGEGEWMGGVGEWGGSDGDDGLGILAGVGGRLGDDRAGEGLAFLGGDRTGEDGLGTSFSLIGEGVTVSPLDFVSKTKLNEEGKSMGGVEVVFCASHSTDTWEGGGK